MTKKQSFKAAMRSYKAMGKHLLTHTGFSMKHLPSFENKNYEYFVKDSVQIKDLHAELNAFSKDGWEIFKLTNYETEMNSYWTIVARKKEMKK